MSDAIPDAPPGEVLERSGSAIQNTSAAATIDSVPIVGNPEADSNSIIVEPFNRMLVRFCHTATESISAHFDEIENRMVRRMQYDDWREYLVVWRKGRLEIYEDYSLPFKEHLLGRKHLASVLPLREGKTHISVYSFVDMTFCITYHHEGGLQSRQRLHLNKEGTDVFIFKLKSRSRAQDWVWKLWLHLLLLGGRLPHLLEVRMPRLDARIKIDIPVDNALTTTMFSRNNIIGLCAQAVRRVGNDWEDIYVRQIAAGKHPELAWRVGTHIDWVWLDSDVDGSPRPWNLLCGLSFRQGLLHPKLEIRLSDHFPRYYHTPCGVRLYEPPAVEGYVDRIRPNIQTRHAVYLSTHHGHLFVLATSHAHPPTPPGLHPPDVQAEVRRGADQVQAALSTLDLRAIVAVRRAEHFVPTTTTSARSHLRKRRSFELLLESGLVMRFEAHSCIVALEWIERLRALIIYWKKRHTVDAREEMDLAQARRPRITPRMRAQQAAPSLETSPDLSTSLPALGSIYNWCVIEGCRAVTRGGRLFMRNGIHGRYKAVEMFVAAGEIVLFRTRPSKSVNVAMKRKVPLFDAYVCSGYFAALALPQGQLSQIDTSLPRRYQDGLEVDDPEDDLLFMVWYRNDKQAGHNSALSAQGHGAEKNTPSSDQSAKPRHSGPGTAANSHKNAVPSLSAKHQLVVFRARSKLERDSWCWVLNCEIEKLIRCNKEREAQIRESGGLKTSKLQ
ncbi:hypothetical protein FISHEDRAFT_50785 [Fistulina hepatica ATCC 64428]|uniref:Uncharacterized protein n=1 Tax=Fistulina hepatica ATCC 64428 TaxID=1128425 RepID=A0A0D7A1Y6_9AGAR|nr:hypothetical protein FISHEDRAFT_50785 [Fistulina hepatica ATCC 64428]